MRGIRYIFGFFALLCTVSATACTDKGSTHEKPEGTITLSAEALTGSFEKQTANITVEATGEWGVYPQVEWVKASPSGGVSGTSVVKLSIDENKTGDVRSGLIEFRTQNSTSRRADCIL